MAAQVVEITDAEAGDREDRERRLPSENLENNRRIAGVFFVIFHIAGSNRQAYNKESYQGNYGGKAI